MPEERHETHGRLLFHFYPSALSLGDDQPLLIAIADRNQQPSAFGELVEQRLRHRRRAGGDENRVVGRVLAPPDAAVAEKKRDVVHAGPMNVLAGLLEERWNSLDREHLGHEMREQHGFVA